MLKKQSTTTYQRKKQRSLQGPSRNLPRNYLFLQSASSTVAPPAAAATATNSTIASVSAAAQRYYAKRPSVSKKERTNASAELQSISFVERVNLRLKRGAQNTAGGRGSACLGEESVGIPSVV